jgi:hypothetical protein
VPRAGKADGDVGGRMTNLEGNMRDWGTLADGSIERNKYMATEFCIEGVEGTAEWQGKGTKLHSNRREGRLPATFVQYFTFVHLLYTFPSMRLV